MADSEVFALRWPIGNKFRVAFGMDAHYGGGNSRTRFPRSHGAGVPLSPRARTD